MDDEESALKKRKREEEEEQRRALQAMELSDDDDRRSNASTTATVEVEDEALGRERAAVRRLLEPFSRDQLLEILTSAATQFSPVLDEIKAVASVDVTHRKVFVRGLAWETKSEHLKEAFSVFGDVQEGVVIYDKATGKSRGFGFVTFFDMDAAQRAVEQQIIPVNGRKATCNMAAVRYHEEHHHFNNHHLHQMNIRGGGLASPVGHTVYTSPMGSVYPMMGLPPPPVSPASSVGGQPGSPSIADRKLFVRGLPWETNDESLRETFLKFGEIEEAAIARDRKTGKSKGYGFVTFKYKVGADRALVQPQKVIDGRTTTCNLASQGAKGAMASPVASVLPGYGLPVAQMAMYAPYTAASPMAQHGMAGYTAYPPQDPYHPQPYGAGPTPYYQQVQPPPPVQTGSHLP